MKAKRQGQILERTWRKDPCPWWLTGVKTRAAAMEISMKVPQKHWLALPSDPAAPLWAVSQHSRQEVEPLEVYRQLHGWRRWNECAEWRTSLLSRRINGTILRKEDETKDVKWNKTNSGRQIACILSNAESRYKFTSLWMVCEGGD